MSQVIDILSPERNTGILRSTFFLSLKAMQWTSRLCIKAKSSAIKGFITTRYTVTWPLSVRAYTPWCLAKYVLLKSHIAFNNEEKADEVTIFSCTYLGLVVCTDGALSMYIRSV